MKNNNLCAAASSAPLSDKLYGSIVDFIDREKMQKALSGGVLVGLSGGADSVFLTLFLLRYQKDFGGGPIVACHVHHGIRGAEADRDADFCRGFCCEIGVEYIEKRVDVPRYAEENKLGLEEAGRNLRYACFAEILDGRHELSTVATAHHATDNAETLLFRLFRGTGSRGLCGIAPVRGRIVRPLLEISKDEIEGALACAGVPFVTDSTNAENEAARNFYRNRVLPVVREAVKNPEEAVSRAIRSLRADEAYLSGLAEAFLRDAGVKVDREGGSCGARIDRKALAALPPPILTRVLVLFFESQGLSPLSEAHIDALVAHLSEGKCGEISLPGGVACLTEEEVFKKTQTEAPLTFERALALGVTELPELGAAIAVSQGEAIFPPLVYKYFINLTARDAIIEGELKVRSRRVGDAYRFGGMTHKLKKMILDRKIPACDKERVAVICDGAGPLWVPGFGIRDDGAPQKNPITIGFYVREDVLSHYGWIRFTERTDLGKVQS